MTKENNEKNTSVGRRDMLKGLATIPFLGALLLAWWNKRRKDHLLNQTIFNELNVSTRLTESEKIVSKEPKLRLGIIGFGIRGEQLLRGAGFPVPSQIDEWIEDAQNDPTNTRYENYLQQEDLNIEINGVCDVYDVRAEKALLASGNGDRLGSDGNIIPKAKRYLHYKDLLQADDIDAVIIATPDHWHTKIAIDAANAGKHVYVEKAMTRTIKETFELVDVIKKSGICFQLGHQGRQTASYNKARELISQNILGPVTLVEVSTNRNSPNGAWVYDIDEEAGPHNIDWEQFTGDGPERPFSLERFFRWRCWWDYGTGLSGDLLTHEYDAMNQILDLGIPHSAVASGGIYFFKDGREVPDTFQVTFEYPKKNLTLLYTATLASNRSRGKVIMGHDANMEVGDVLTVWADYESTRYKEMIDKGILESDTPLFSYIPGRKKVDAVTTATEKYFAGRGLLYTYRNGVRVDTTHLHIKEWLDCIRTGQQPSCNIDRGFEEAITAHMATLAYRENRKVFWDPEKMKVV
ncbi:MAG: oxidoreductase [Bacteroides sp. SM23_62_1]|nr:MAG: oxidoreductase [Bacteroides sp. SM23_62_1]